jgi:Enoyl-CoA hydratase/isomerase
MASHRSCVGSDRDRYSPLTGDAVVVVDCAAPDLPSLRPNPLAVVIGVDRAGVCPAVVAGHFDVLLSTAADPSAPWIGVADVDAAAAGLAEAVRARPVAAVLLCRLLRMQDEAKLAGAGFAAALERESLAYSTLLGGAEFAGWLAERGDETDAGHPIPELPLATVYADVGPGVTLTLADPANRNAISAPMRDALHAALANALDDPGQPRVTIRGEGRCFSVGGHLPEFGSARDLAVAHLIRIQRNCALLLDALGERASVELHGACIGSGLEIFAACADVVASPDAWFQLPELAMGLIPGAGGTATVTRRTGRHRAAWLMLTGKRIDARQALDWGLVDRIG